MCVCVCVNRCAYERKLKVNNTVCACACVCVCSSLHEYEKKPKGTQSRSRKDKHRHTRTHTHTHTHAHTHTQHTHSRLRRIPRSQCPSKQKISKNAASVPLHQQPVPRYIYFFFFKPTIQDFSQHRCSHCLPNTLHAYREHILLHIENTFYLFRAKMQPLSSSTVDMRLVLKSQCPSTFTR